MSVNYKRIVKCLYSVQRSPSRNKSACTAFNVQCVYIIYVYIYIKIIFVYRYLSIGSYKDIQMYNLNMFAEMDCFKHIYLLL